MNRQIINATAIIFITLLFGGMIVLFFLYINQQRLPPQYDDTLLKEETIVGIDQPPQETQALKAKKENYNPKNKPFPEDSYLYDYDERTADFRLVCSKPCPISTEILNQEFAAIAYAVSTARGLTQSDIDLELLPFEVHASEDSTCLFDESALAYMTRFIDENGYRRGLLCFFYEKNSYDRTKFPYSTSIHEVNHLLQEGKFPPYMGAGMAITEGLSMVLDSFFEKGNEKNSFCWQGNNWYSNVASKVDSPHIKGAGLFFELCKQYGFDYKDLPALFDQLEEQNGEVDISKFVVIINNIVGKDTSHLFQELGILN